MGENIGKNIKDIRNKRNMTQRRLAEKSNTSQVTIYSIEKGKTQNPSIILIINIAKALGVSINTIIK